MKISYRNHPSIEKLQNGLFGKMNYSTEDEKIVRGKNFARGYEIWKASSHWFKSEINYISKPFFDSAQKAGVKLNELYFDTLRSKNIDINFSGTIIISGGFTFMFHHEYDTKNDIFVASIYWFNDHKNMLLGYANSATRGVNQTKNDWDWWMADDYKKSFSLFTEDQEVEEIMMLFGMCITLMMFKKYAEVETKILKPNSKIKDDIGCKYINDTKLSITWLDSKWFTNLVKSDAFTVRGHFRLQACGSGLKDHKIIWINEFTKTGYTAPARKLSKDDTLLQEKDR